jgi:hypothetical protein
MKRNLEDKHITNDTWEFKGYKRARENEIREKEKKKRANRRKNKMK